MSFGTAVAQSHCVSSNGNNVRHRNASRKKPRFSYDRSFKAKAFQDSPTESLDSRIQMAAAIHIPRRRRGERGRHEAIPPDGSVPYAGAKFSSPPPPSVLPKPPSHWIASPIHNFDMDVAAMSKHLRMLLRVES